MPFERHSVRESRSIKTTSTQSPRQKESDVIQHAKDMCRAAIDHHASTGEWPRADHPTMGRLMHLAALQFGKASKNKAPTFSAEYPLDVHSLLRRHGYTPPQAVRSAVKQSPFLQKIWKKIEDSLPLTTAEMNKLRARYNGGHFGEETKQKLTAYGMVF